jgi:hypothetical protein
MDRSVMPATRARGVGVWLGCAAAILLSAAPAAAGAEEGGGYHLGGGEGKLETRISYQLMPTYQVIDNGDLSSGRIGDLPSHQSYIRAAGHGMGAGPFTWGYKAELGLNFNSLQFQDYNGTASGPDYNIRTAQTWYKTPYGKFVLGQGAGAARYATRQDLLGTDIVSDFDFRRLENATFHPNSGTTTLTPAMLFPELAGERSGRIKYMTPRFGGLKMGYSYAPDNDEQEFQVRYRNGAGEGDEEAAEAGGGVSFKTAAAYVRSTEGYTAFGVLDEPVDYRIAWSGSAMFNHFGLTASYGNQHFKDGALPPNWATFVKAGYNFGPNTVSATYGLSRGVEAFNVGKVEGLIYELAYALDLDPYILGLAISVLQADPTDPAAPSVDDLHTAMLVLGVRG